MRQWDQVSEEFARVSLAADEAPVGVERVRAHEGALRLAQADGSFAEEFVARTDLTQALYHVPRDPQNLVHFTWLRRSLEPEHGLDQEDRDAVLWRLKWAVDLVEDIPEVPLSTLVAAIDDVEEVFRADGYHLRPVHAARARLAQHTGDEQGAARELAAWLAEPRDSRSDCPACEHRDQSRSSPPRTPGGPSSCSLPSSRASSRAATSRAPASATPPACVWAWATSRGRSTPSAAPGTSRRTTPSARARWRSACGCSCGSATPTGPSTSSSPGSAGSTSSTRRAPGCGSPRPPPTSSTAPTSSAWPRRRSTVAR